MDRVHAMPTAARMAVRKRKSRTTHHANVVASLSPGTEPSAIRSFSIAAVVVAEVPGTAEVTRTEVILPAVGAIVEALAHSLKCGASVGIPVGKVVGTRVVGAMVRPKVQISKKSTFWTF